MQHQTFPSLGEHYAEALGLTPPWVITDIDLNITNQTLDIVVSYNSKTGTCPECGNTTPVEDHREERSWRHLNMMQFTTTIRCRTPRIRGPEHKCRTVNTPWAGPRSHFTLLFERFAIEVLQATTNITKARSLLGISWFQARKIMERAVTRGLARRNKEEAIAHVGLDEKSFLKGHHYATLATDIDRGCVLDVEEHRTEEATTSLLNRAIPEAKHGEVQAVAVDMWKPFANAAQAVFGEDIDIVHDKFHVAGYLGKAVDLVRKKEHREFKKDGEDTLTKTKYLWLKDPDNWREKEREVFESLRTDELKVGKAWSIKEAFRGFWECVQESEAERFFKRWYFWATHSRLQPVIGAAKTLKRHLDGLLAYVKHRITNAVTEGLNSKIQAVKANARGFRNFAHYRVAILFHCGKLEMFP